MPFEPIAGEIGRSYGVPESGGLRYQSTGCRRDGQAQPTTRRGLGRVETLSDSFLQKPR